MQNEGILVNTGLQPMIFVKMDKKKWDKEEKQQCFYTLGWKAIRQDILIL